MTKEEILLYADFLEAYVDTFITPLSYDKGNDNGALCGTGAYVSKGNRVYLITSAHIISELKRISEKKEKLVLSKYLFEYEEKFDPIEALFCK